MRLQGEACDVNLVESEVLMSQFRAKLEDGGYRKENIFNMDETALFYRALPNQSYICSTGTQGSLLKEPKR